MYNLPFTDTVHSGLDSSQGTALKARIEQELDDFMRHYQNLMSRQSGAMAGYSCAAACVCRLSGLGGPGVPAQRAGPAHIRMSRSLAYIGTRLRELEIIPDLVQTYA